MSMKVNEKRGRWYRITNAIVPLSEAEDTARGVGVSVGRVRHRAADAIEGLRAAWRDRHVVHDVDPASIVVPTGAERQRTLRSARMAWASGAGMIVVSLGLSAMYLGVSFAFWWQSMSALLGVTALLLLGGITVLASAADTRSVLNAEPVSMRDVATTPAWWLPW